MNWARVSNFQFKRISIIHKYSIKKIKQVIQETNFLLFEF